MAENDKLNNDDSTFKETKENKSSKKIEGYDDYYKSLTSGSDEHDNDIDYHEDSHVNTRTTTSSKKFNHIAFLFLELIYLNAISEWINAIFDTTSSIYPASV